MTTYDPTQEESTDPRPRYLSLGTDNAGAHHVYRTFDETVHVVAATGGREHVEHLGGRSVDDWMAFVADRRGWAHRDYYATLGAALAARLGGAV